MYIQQQVTGRFVRETNIVRSGSYAIKAEVHPGDNLSSSGERAEVCGAIDVNGNVIGENESSGTKYYTISLFCQLTGNHQQQQHQQIHIIMFGDCLCSYMGQMS